MLEFSVMDSNKILDQYLFELEKHLQDINPRDKSKIILEIDEHIQESLEKYPDQDIKVILEDIGEAQKVANHYRLNKGLKLFKPEKHPFLKWLGIMFITCFSLFILAVGLVVWKFTPIFEVDEKEGRVVVLGGLLDINRNSGKVKIMDQYHFTENNYSNQFDGTIDFPKEETDELVFNFKSGLFNFTTSEDEKLSWNCKLDSPPTENFLNQSDETVEIDLEEYEGANCDIKVPSGIKLTIDGKDANISFTDTEYDLYLEMENGQVTFTSNPEVDYNYDINVKNGVSDTFTSSEKPDAYEIKIYLDNGLVKQ